MRVILENLRLTADISKFPDLTPYFILLFFCVVGVNLKAKICELETQTLVEVKAMVT